MNLHNIKNIVFGGIATSLLVLPIGVMAETVVRTADSISVQEDESIANDFYVAANTISMSGEVAGDMYATGGAVTVNGPIEADLTVLGGSVQLHATVTDDVRVLAGEVVLADYVGGDVFVMSGLLKVLSTAEIEGDIFFFGGTAEINGSVGGSVMGTYETLRVNAPVAGDIDVAASRGLTLGARAAIEGDVQYISSREIVRAQDAVVAGVLVRNTTASAGGATDWTWLVTMMLLSMFGTLVLYLIAKPLLQRMVNTPMRKVGISGLWGLLALLIVPLIIIVLLVAVLSAVVGLTMWFLFMATLLIAYVAIPVFVGAWLCQYLFSSTTLKITTVLLGVVVTNVLLLVPYIGTTIVSVLFILVFGVLLRICVSFAMRAHE